MTQRRILDCGDDGPLRTPDPACRNAAAHAPQPRLATGAAWTQAARETARQEPCPDCGGWSVWVPHARHPS